MLDFGVTKEANGGLVRGSPEFSLCKIKRVIETNSWVELLGKSLKISLLKHTNDIKSELNVNSYFTIKKKDFILKVMCTGI